MADAKNYYEVLGLSENATDDEIKKAFRKLAAQNHPDRGGDEQRFKEISEAYTTLSDPQKKEEYDQMLKYGFGGFGQGGFGGFGGYGATGGQGQRVYTQGGSWEDIFSAMGGQGGFDFSSFMGGFGGGASSGAYGGRAARRAQKGRDIKLKLQLSFDEAFSGVKKRMTYKIATTGEEKTLSVSVPAGAVDGGKLRFKGRGEPGQGPGAQAGDLIVETSIAAHPIFSREGAHVHLEAKVSIFEAALGCQITVPTPNGSRVKLKIPAGTEDGKVFKCKDFGAPDLKHKGKMGSLFVTIRLVVPHSLSAQEKEQLQDLMKADTRSYREELDSYGSHS